MSTEPKVELTPEHREILKEWFKLQNELLEPLPKKLQGTYHPAIDVGLAMEHAMDIARELSKWPNTHLPYIEQKLRFLESDMKELDYYLGRKWRIAYPDKWERKWRGEEEGWLTKPEWMSEEEWLRMTPCVVCGRRGWDEYHVPDEEWRKYVPQEYQDKEVCYPCFQKFKREAQKKEKG